MTQEQDITEIERLTNQRFRVLSAMPDAGVEISAQSLAKRAGIPLTRVRRALNALKEIGLVQDRWPDVECKVWSRVPTEVIA